jgi:hypothetical protein
VSSAHQVYVDRWRERARAQKIHDWRLTLLPIAIEIIGHRGRAIQLCKALCDRQKGYHPEVIASTYDLAEELGMDRRNLYRETRLLIRAGLLRVVIGGGRLPAPRGAAGRADVYQLGPVVAPQIEGILNSVTQDAVSTQQTASHTTLYRRRARSANSVTQDAPTPLGVLRTPSGDTGERTAALTGGSSPAELSSPTIAPHRFRDLLGILNLGKRSSPNAL